MEESPSQPLQPSALSATLSVPSQPLPSKAASAESSKLADSPERTPDPGTFAEFEEEEMPPAEILNRLAQMKREGRLPTLEQLREALKGTPLDPGT